LHDWDAERSGHRADFRLAPSSPYDKVENEIMKQSIVTIAVVGMTVLATALANAQPVPSAPGSGAPAYGFTPPPGTPVTPDNQGSQGAVPPVGRQIQAARGVQASDPGNQPASLLHQADQALTKHKVAVANELLERAQTAALNMGQVDNDTSGRLVSALSRAKEAVVAGSMGEAHQRIADALGLLPSRATRPARQRR
jgi:hypothetical protein